MSIRLEDSRVSIRRLIWIGPLTVASSIVAVMIVRAIAVALLHPASSFVPLQVLPPILDTTGLVTWAVLIFAAMTRFLNNAIERFRIVALVVLLVSFLPDIALARRGWFGGTWLEAVALMAMHIAAWAVCVTMLTRSGSADPPSHPSQIRIKHVGYFLLVVILAVTFPRI